MNEIESVLQEDRKFPCSAKFRNEAHISGKEAYLEEYEESIDDIEGFWESVADELSWFKKPRTILDDSNKPFYKWYTGGKINACYNCVDQHLKVDPEGRSNGNKAALIWEGEPGDTRVLTYQDVHREVCKFANGLKKLGIGKGDRVAIYLPMIPELVLATLACARIGAVHTVIFAGFSAQSIRDRVIDCEARCVITADAGWRRGQILPLKNTVDEAVNGLDCVKDVIIVKRGHGDPFPCHVKEGRDHWYHRLVQDQPIDCPCEEMDSEDMLFLLYTSGTTGKPKGVIHTTAGYLAYTYLTAQYVFDLKPADVFWCTADIGWITGHSYIVYGPMQNGVTQILYEGAPNYPDSGRFWEIIEKYRATIFYTAPTAIRAFMKWGDQWVNKYDLSSLRLLGSVGEPINPEAWMWYYKTIGKEKCPIVDTWWQTETGGILLTTLPGAHSAKPGSCGFPFLGIEPKILDEDGDETKTGLLAIANPWPGMMRGIYGDEERYKETYWSKWRGNFYFPGDGARIDKDGYYWILGRVDDVVNVSGHRIGTAELESIYIEDQRIAEAAVIGIKHEIKGECLVSFITVKDGVEPDEALEAELNQLVEQKIGKFARPDRIIWTGDLPKTRSGKIMRRLLRDIAEGRAMGNVTTLADPSVVEALKAKYSE